ncbi:adenylate/guanylate cyclase domain-containing protein [Roseivirga pacifica]|uniref:adenylate/guanylate cyclase domain-containing protein n=1 Tax=Roseivirga pacifica TaxID=1267423 RepID=UPI002094AFAA|nr:adenylate/guanylate cyclase domain-containing protein [Roseivirga pacifica]MCO6357092.1 hypothetical protein [Roseivirga pacifica]MCO6368195.1 hypothetical protein [Roseivirga pacifica]MCO6369324.1 hypothetical protein [Roseivirga pacifica]MCO6373178.1 hypothetical protein [Roseivirga pacifica]MCO6377565.1 hypothetical protein [Roseivirga pacifica]
MKQFYTKYRELLLIIRDYVTGWLIALTLWVIVRNVGVTVNAPASPSSMDSIQLILLFGIMAGVLFGIAQYKIERYHYGKVPLWGLACYGLAINGSIMLLIYWLAFFFFKWVVGFETYTFSQFLTNPNSILAFAYMVLVSSVMAALRQVNLLLGKGNLLRLIKGQFYQPRVERRVFLFVDLKGSTQIAEQIGHLAYSKFLQDCYRDLSVVEQFGAEVYQYVGDEVVLSWNIKPGMNYMNCMLAFWAFQQKLKEKKAYYERQYGIQPIFKAGLHLGEVTTAEVGQIKREIAYHGDTINVTSRIQEKCNAYDSELLVSERFLDTIHINGKFRAELKGEEILRGKQEAIKLYSIEQK